MDVAMILSVALNHTAPILLVAIGGLFAVKADVFNLALEGFMLIAAFFSIVGTYYFDSYIAGIILAVLSSTVLIMIYAVFILELNVKPIICAISIITLSSGLTRYLLNPFFGVSGRYVLSSEYALPKIELGPLEKIPLISEVLSDHSILVYLSFVFALVCHFVLKKTKFGLNLKATGLNKDAAVAAGINVKKIKYQALFINGVLCGLGGAELALSVHMFNVGMTNGRGYTALAAIILSNSSPLVCILASMLFGLAESLVITFSTVGVSSYLLGMLPYVLALLAAILPQVFIRIRSYFKQVRAEEIYLK